MLKLIYSFSKIIPRSSKPDILTFVPIGRSSGFAIFGKNPDIRKSTLSILITAQAYGAYFQNLWAELS